MNDYHSLGKEYILQTQLNKERFGKRRKTQLNNLFNRNKNINKLSYPNIKPVNLDNIKIKEDKLLSFYKWINERG